MPFSRSLLPHVLQAGAHLPAGTVHASEVNTEADALGMSAATIKNLFGIREATLDDCGACLLSQTRVRSESLHLA